MRLYHTKLFPVSFVATTEAPGYPANNLGSESLALPWRATGLGATTVTITLQGLSSMMALGLHDVNFATCTVDRSVDGAAWVNVGVLTSYADRHGRRRGSIFINTAGQLAVRFVIGAGASTDGLGYWRGGAVQLFSSLATVGALPEYGYRVRTRRPRIATELRNRRIAMASTGMNLDRIALSFGNRLPTETLDEFIARTTSGTCWLNMELSDYPEQQWPVRFLEEDAEEVFARKKLSSTDVVLTEVA